MSSSPTSDRFEKSYDKQGNLIIRVVEDAVGNLLQIAEVYSATNPPSSAEFPDWNALVNVVDAFINSNSSSIYTFHRIVLNGISAFTFPSNTVEFNVKPQTISGTPTFDDKLGNVTPIYPNEGSIQGAAEGACPVLGNFPTVVSTTGDVIIIEYFTI